MRSKGSFYRSPVNLTAQGDKLYGELLIPQHAEPPFPAAILCHGMSVDSRAMRPSAEPIAKRGVASFTFDFGGHGRSTGIYDSYRVADVMAAFEWLSSHPQVDSQRIALVGHSIGAIAAILAAADLGEVYALVVLSCPPQNFVFENIRSFSPFHKYRTKGKTVFEYPRDGLLPWLNPFLGIIIWLWMCLRGYRMRIDWQKFIEVWRKTDVLAALKRRKPCPLLWVHCRGDKFSPDQVSLSLYEQAQPPKEVLLCEKGSHTTPLLPGKVREAWLSWLVSTLTSRSENVS